MKRLRILYVLPFLSCGGSSKLVLDIEEFISREDGVETKLCVLKRGEIFFSDKPSVNPIVFCDYNGDYRKVKATRDCVNDLVRMINEYKPDLVHSFLWIADYIAAKASLRCAVPHVAHFIDTRPWLDSRRVADRVKKYFYKRAMRKAGTRYIACTEEVRQYTARALAMDESAFPVIANAIDSEEYPYIKRRGCSNRKIVLGAAGRFDREKGHDLLIHAASLLRDKGLDYELLIAGSGSLGPEYEKSIADLCLQEHVKLPGLVTDIYEFYLRLDLFVMPSLYAEGLPLAVLGAMATGLPVIATRTAGVNDVIRDGKDGVLLVSNSPSSIAEAVMNIHKDPDSLSKMGAAASQRVRDSFDIRGVVSELRDYYRSIL